MRSKGISSGRLKCLAALAFGKLQLGAVEKELLVDRLVRGKTSFRELTNHEADVVIDHLKRLAGQTPTRPVEGDRRRLRRSAQTGDVAILITPAQRERLAQLTRDLIALEIGPNYLAGVRLRACGRPEPATSFEAEKAIEALKALLERAQAGWLPPEGA